MTPPPSPITEAAGLLGSGAIFARRVGLRSAGDPQGDAAILVGIKRGGCSIYWGDEPIAHFDRDGRWQRAFLDGTHYLKGLDAQVRAVDRPREEGAMVLRRRTLPLAEVAALDARVAGLAQTLGADLAAGRFELLPPPAPARAIDRDDLSALLSHIAAWTPSAWAEHRAHYVRAYGDAPPPFLPPDCPNPVILRPERGMTPPELRDQARGVAALLGGRLGQCRDVFLAGPGWIDRPADGVVALLGAVAEVFPIQPDQGRPRGAEAPEDTPRLETIHGWLAVVPSIPPSRDDWVRFRAAHLGRVSLPVDPWSGFDPGMLQSVVVELKAAGIGVGLVVSLDPGGDADLADLVAALPLGAGDLISLVATGDQAVNPAPLVALKARLVAALPRGPRVVVYNPDKQWI